LRIEAERPGPRLVASLDPAWLGSYLRAYSVLYATFYASLVQDYVRPGLTYTTSSSPFLFVAGHWAGQKRKEGNKDTAKRAVTAWEEA